MSNLVESWAKDLRNKHSAFLAANTPAGEELRCDIFAKSVPIWTHFLGVGPWFEKKYLLLVTNKSLHAIRIRGVNTAISKETIPLTSVKQTEIKKGILSTRAVIRLNDGAKYLFSGLNAKHVDKFRQAMEEIESGSERFRQ
jgi:hypothetical protein